MSTDSSQLIAHEAWLRVLLPHAEARRDKVISQGTRFSHYTSADAAMKLLASEQVWLRNALLMNDFAQVHHGHVCLSTAWKDEAAGGRLRALLDSLQPGLSQELAATFDRGVDNRVAETYLISISEHDIGEEDRYGRLSMWRAYGGDTNVAFVMHNHAFTARTDAVGAYTSPVLYEEPLGFVVLFRDWVAGLEGHRDLLASRGPVILPHRSGPP